jgi:sulfoacetaldehyde dehydrogenase
VLTLYRYTADPADPADPASDGASGVTQAVAIVNAITGYQGLGHTCGIHTRDDAHVEALAMGTRTGRVLVNQNLNEGAGSARNGLPFTLSLSCGTWGGNITTENVNARHFVNLTWVSRTVAARTVDEDDLFGAHWARHGR